MQASGQRDREVPIAVAVSRHTEGPNVPWSMAVARAATLRLTDALAWLGCGAVETRWPGPASACGCRAREYVTPHPGGQGDVLQLREGAGTLLYVPNNSSYAGLRE
jgi:hypothetical protein